MRQFLKFTLASMLGFIFAGLLLFALIAAVIAGLASSGKKQVAVAENSVLHLDFGAPIVDRSSEDPFANFNFMSFEGGNTAVSVSDYVDALAKAAEDDKIKGIFLDLAGVEADQTIRMRIRRALVDFKESGKFIYAYSEGYSQADYLLASVADSIFMVPVGEMMFNGLSSSPTFFKGMLDKLEIDVKLIRVGKYKSAGEPFIRQNLSDDNRYQISSYLNSMYDQMLAAYADGRKIPVDSLHAMASEFRIRNAKDAVTHGLVDRLAYRDEVLELLAKETKAKTIEKIELVGIQDYITALPQTKQTETKDRIAVIYAIGEIQGGEGDDQTIGSDRIAAAIRKARFDDKVKAIVLRVNSPGGSALASDVIWRETELAKKAKPFVVSMGSLAASGGYYIAAGADSIFAAPNTITGSIGVFGLIPTFDKFMKSKIGITFDRVVTGPYADALNGLRPMTADEEQIIQGMVNRIYEEFVQVVAKGRSLPVDSIHAMAQGRVYTGEQALKLGLVDRMGDLDDAIACAARMAKLENYKLRELPDQENPIEKALEDLMNAKSKSVMQELGPLYNNYVTAKRVLEGHPFQARLEWENLRPY
ncbi:MAG: signal peptide peptidase SppA [Sphingobacteriaceae bacterium]|nr:signal peptide peptidase SppA [Sphingobacteriaceae bacterium]